MREPFVGQKKRGKGCYRSTRKAESPLQGMGEFQLIWV